MEEHLLIFQITCAQVQSTRKYRARGRHSFILQSKGVAGNSIFFSQMASNAPPA